MQPIRIITRRERLILWSIVAAVLVLILLIARTS